MLNNFLKQFEPGTKILLSYTEGITVVKSEVVTISSINWYNEDLYTVKFKEPHLMGSYAFLKDALLRMKLNYDMMPQ